MPTLSACLIVRDEELNLDACLEALEPFVDEICVMDTGSTDGSLAVAQRFGAKIETMEWGDDFSAARNACLELATSDWVLCVDADEILDPESAPGLRAVLEDQTTQAFLVWLDNLDGGTDAQGRPSLHSIGVPRLFRNRPEIRFARRVHESIAASLSELRAGPLEHSHLRLVHHGYLPDAVSLGHKHERNLALLALQLRENPEDLFASYKLATSQLAVGQQDLARKTLAETWRRATNLAGGPRLALPFLPLVAAELIRAWRLLGDMSRAAVVAQEALKDYGSVSEVLFESAELERACGNLEAAGAHYVAARSSVPWTDLYTGRPDTRGCLPLCGLARVSALAGDLDLASTCVAQALELAPQHLEARTIAARLATATSQEDQAWAELSTLLAEAPEDPHVQLFAAEMAWSRQETETARGFWLGALDQPVSSSNARAWLAILELVAGNLPGAQAHRSQLLPADLPEAGALCVLDAVAGRALTLDSRFESAALLGEVRAWLGELGRDPKERALGPFLAGLDVLAPRLGDLKAIMVTHSR